MPLRYTGQNGENAILCRFTEKSHGFCADIGAFDGALLSLSNPEKISSRIVNEIVAVNTVVLDATSNPPGRIAWK
jgi:GMP synthase PP-ATPase subunit